MCVVLEKQPICVLSEDPRECRTLTLGKKVTSFSKLQTTSHYFETEHKRCLSYQMYNNIWCWDIVQQSERADYLVPPPSDTRISDGYCLTRGRPITWYIDEGEHSQHWGLQGNHICGIRRKLTLHVVQYVVHLCIFRNNICTIYMGAQTIFA